MSCLNKLSLCLLLSALPAVSVTAADIEKLNTDVVVVGGGGTGMSAAASAHQHGAKVILLEKLAFVGGSSALSGGALAAGESNPQKRAGTKDVSNEGFVNIWLKDQDRSFPGGDESMPKLDRMQKLAKEFNTTVNWMESDIGHKFAVPRPFGYGGPNYAHAPAEAPIPASGRGSAHAGGRFVIKALRHIWTKPAYLS